MKKQQIPYCIVIVFTWTWLWTHDLPHSRSAPPILWTFQTDVLIIYVHTSMTTAGNTLFYKVYSYIIVITCCQSIVNVLRSKFVLFPRVNHMSFILLLYYCYLFFLVFNLTHKKYLFLWFSLFSLILTKIVFLILFSFPKCVLNQYFKLKLDEISTLLFYLQNK